jgi:hypothetical protein
MRMLLNKRLKNGNKFIYVGAVAASLAARVLVKV